MPLRLTQWLADSRIAAQELAQVIRELIAVAVTALAPSDALVGATALVREAIAHLRGYVPDGPLARYPELGSVSGPADVMPFDPIIGPFNPLSPPLVLAGEDGRVAGSIVFTTPYEGPPGCVHGGIIAACFDQVLNVANMLAGAAGPTASLEIRYRKPTPLGVTLRFEAGPPVVDGRQVRTSGILRDGDTVLAEASGVFVLLPFDRLMALTSERR